MTVEIRTLCKQLTADRSELRVELVEQVVYNSSKLRGAVCAGVQGLGYVSPGEQATTRRARQTTVSARLLFDGSRETIV
jgi:hypothetical protein